MSAPHGQHSQFGGGQQPQPLVGYGQQSDDLLSATPTPTGGRTKRVAAAVAAVVALGGGVATYVAVSSSNAAAGGAASPRAAVTDFVADLNNGDVVGMLDDLPPGERSAISRPLLDTASSLKRNDVLRPDADLSKVSGFGLGVQHLTYAASTVPINDHVQIVQLTGGTLRADTDATKLPFTADFLHAVRADTASATSAQQTIDIAQVVRRTGKPIRIATQKVGGRWYPSLMYTIADNAVTSEHLTAPAAAERIPAVGAASADEAVRSLISALLSANVQRALELLSPDELAVVHDYGRLIVDRSHYSPPGVRIDKIAFQDTAISGGTRVTVRSIALTSRGHTFSATLNGSCFILKADGRSQHHCLADGLLGSGASIGSGAKSPLTPRQRTALAHLSSGMTAVGVDVTTSGGRYYISPVRSYLELVNELLSGLKNDDGKVLLRLIHS